MARGRKKKGCFPTYSNRNSGGYVHTKKQKLPKIGSARGIKYSSSYKEPRKPTPEEEKAFGPVAFILFIALALLFGYWWVETESGIFGVFMAAFIINAINQYTKF